VITNYAPQFVILSMRSTIFQSLSALSDHVATGCRRNSGGPERQSFASWITKFWVARGRCLRQFGIMTEALPVTKSATAVNDESNLRNLFPQTMWSMVAGTRDANEAQALVALERLARAYWQPLYVFLRQRNRSHEDAADSVQGFFEHLVNREMLQRVELRETRFRTFLLRCFQNWLISAHRRDQAQKRGGSAVIVSLSEMDSASHGVALDPQESPELAFDRRWAQTIFQRTQAKLDQEIALRERPDYLQELKSRIFHPSPEGPHWAEVAERFAVSEGAVRKAALDLRSRFAGLLREEVSELVSCETEVDEELRYLFYLLSHH
jgi:RNA polymerase sigma factor (sigma-70 family)